MICLVTKHLDEVGSVVETTVAKWSRNNSAMSFREAQSMAVAVTTSHSSTVAVRDVDDDTDWREMAIEASERIPVATF